jgi:multiple sugar transport system ATP-binding protein
VASITFERVVKAYPGGPPVLAGLDLAIEAGELVTLVGPSGSGKSTALDLVAGFEAPTSGHVRIDGEIVDHRPPRERGIAMVFQSYALYPHLSVGKNLAFPLEVARVDRSEIARRVREMAERLGLEALLDRKPKELSGGQRQRVALGRALIRRPRICLLDEPLSTLDASLRARMRAEIKKLHEELGATFVYVTHDQAEAMTLSDRLIVLDRGEIQQAAPPEEIYERPANTFVASFVGSPPINLLRPATLSAPAEVTARASGREVVVGLRPESLEIGAGAPGEGAVAGVIYVVEPMGAETWITVEIGGERVTGKATTDFRGRSGEGAWLRADWRRAMLFDARSGVRIAG